MEKKNNYIKTKGLLLSTIIVLLLCMNSNLHAATTEDEMNPKQSLNPLVVRKGDVLLGIYSAPSLPQEYYAARTGLVVLAVIVVLILFGKQIKEPSSEQELTAIAYLLGCVALLAPEGYFTITYSIILAIMPLVILCNGYIKGTNKPKNKCAK